MGGDDFDLDDYLNKLTLETEAVRNITTGAGYPPPGQSTNTFDDNNEFPVQDFTAMSLDTPSPSSSTPSSVVADAGGSAAAPEATGEMAVLLRAEKHLDELCNWLNQELQRQNRKTSRKMARNLRKKCKAFFERFGKVKKGSQALLLPYSFHCYLLPCWVSPD